MEGSLTEFEVASKAELSAAVGYWELVEEVQFYHIGKIADIEPDMELLEQVEQKKFRVAQQLQCSYCKGHWNHKLADRFRHCLQV